MTAATKDAGVRYALACRITEVCQSDALIHSLLSGTYTELAYKGTASRFPVEYLKVADDLVAQGAQKGRLPKSQIIFMVGHYLVSGAPVVYVKAPAATKLPPQMEELERIVKEGRSTAAKARALLTLRRARPRDLQEGSFVRYCEQSLGITDSHVYRLLDFAGQLELLSNLPGVRAPENERQLRVLNRLPKEEWAAAWTAANLGCPSKVSGRQVGLVVEDMLQQKAVLTGGQAEVSVKVPTTAAEPVVEAPAAPAPAPQVSAPEEPAKSTGLRSETMNALVQNRIEEMRKVLGDAERLHPRFSCFDNLDRLLREIEAANKIPDRTVDAPPSQYSTEGFDPAKMRQPHYRGKVDSWLDRLICKVGIHDWQPDSATVVDDLNHRHIALGWAVCRRCSESKLTMILR